MARRTLVLVRHAKSEWGDAALPDHERPLAPRGERALDAMREHVAATGIRPDLVLCSTARRAVDTLEGVRAALPEDTPVELDPAIYRADAADLLERVGWFDDDIACAMVVGHNPTLHELSFTLVGSGDEESWNQLRSKLPTGAIVTMSFEGEWTSLSAGTAHLDTLFTPRSPRALPDPGHPPRPPGAD